MIDSGRVEGVIAAMAATSDGWRLSCDLNNIRDDGKVTTAFNVASTGTPCTSCLSAATATTANLTSFEEPCTSPEAIRSAAVFSSVPPWAYEWRELCTGVQRQ